APLRAAFRQAFELFSEARRRVGVAPLALLDALGKAQGNLLHAFRDLADRLRAGVFHLAQARLERAVLHCVFAQPVFSLNKTALHRLAEHADLLADFAERTRVALVRFLERPLQFVDAGLGPGDRVRRLRADAFDLLAQFAAEHLELFLELPGNALRGRLARLFLGAAQAVVQMCEGRLQRTHGVV